MAPGASEGKNARNPMVDGQLQVTAPNDSTEKVVAGQRRVPAAYLDLVHNRVNS